MKSGFLDKLIERLDKLDPRNLQLHFLRLAREKGFLEAIFNTIQESVLVVDRDGLIVYANSSAAALLGLELEGMLRQPIARFLRGVDWERVLNLEATEWSRLINRELEINYPRDRLLNFYMMPIALDDRPGKGAMVILRDITRERERELDLLQSERLNALTLLAAGVAHEIGNPLNSLHIHLQLLERALQSREHTDTGAMLNLLKVAKTEVDRLHLTITQFLRAIRPTTLRFEPARVEELLDETLAFMKHEIENRDVITHVKVSEPVPIVQADRNQIKQAFFNLIKNALQAMSGGGILSISVFAADQAVGISFADTGAGIPPERLGRLFEPYGTTKPDGTGLGLMIVQRIVREHGGQIEVASKPGTGTTFTILLPIEQRRVRLLKAPRRRGARGGNGKEPE